LRVIPDNKDYCIVENNAQLEHKSQVSLRSNLRSLKIFYAVKSRLRDIVP